MEPETGNGEVEDRKPARVREKRSWSRVGQRTRIIHNP